VYYVQVVVEEGEINQVHSTPDPGRSLLTLTRRVRAYRECRNTNGYTRERIPGCNHIGSAACSENMFFHVDACLFLTVTTSTILLSRSVTEHLNDITYHIRKDRLLDNAVSTYF